ncbi:MAG: polysaccharide lyase family 1 protein, partial [Exilibacterium sp.]
DVSRVWVDHCDFTAFTDGLLDITVRSTDITVSWNHFWDHGKGMLISASDSDTFDDIIRVTIHHNYFHDIIERQPRVRFGRVHVFNNLIKDWQDYGIRSAIEAKVLVENNIFSAGNGSTTAVEVRQDGAVRASGNLLLNGAATIPQNKTDEVFDAEDYYSYKLDTANSALQSTLESETGWQDVALPGGI